MEAVKEATAEKTVEVKAVVAEKTEAVTEKATEIESMKKEVENLSK